MTHNFPFTAEETGGFHSISSAKVYKDLISHWVHFNSRAPRVSPLLLLLIFSRLFTIWHREGFQFFSASWKWWWRDGKWKNEKKKNSKRGNLFQSEHNSSFFFPRVRYFLLVVAFVATQHKKGSEGSQKSLETFYAFLSCSNFSLRSLFLQFKWRIVKAKHEESVITSWNSLRWMEATKAPHGVTLSLYKLINFSSRKHSKVDFSLDPLSRELIELKWSWTIIEGWL